MTYDKTELVLFAAFWVGIGGLVGVMGGVHSEVHSCEGQAGRRFVACEGYSDVDSCERRARHKYAECENNVDE